MEVDIILRIPLSLRRTEDRLVWHYDKKGMYSVRNGYHGARMEEGKKDSASSSNGVVGAKGKYWNVIWHSKIPPKVRVFVWRLVKGILPTWELLVRRVPLTDARCVFCMKYVETGLHVFRDCEKIAWFWSCTLLGLMPKFVPTMSLEEWVLNVVDQFTAGQQCAFFMALWVIWSERNNVVWKGSIFNASCASCSMGPEISRRLSSSPCY